VTPLQELHGSVVDWFIHHGGKLSKVKSTDFELTEIRTQSWTVFIGPDTRSDDSYQTQTKSLEVAILIDPNIDLGRYEEDEFRYLVDEMQDHIQDDTVTLMPSFPDLSALWLARSINVEEKVQETLNPILEFLSFWADAAYLKFATWPNAPRIQLLKKD